jgi:hypothetical protein
MRGEAMKWIGLGLVAATLSLAAPAHAQDDAALATLRSSMSAQAYASFSTILRDARERGLPTQPLVAKGLEGAAKNVPGDRILLAVRQTADALGTAQRLLRPAGITSAAEIGAVATAMQRGVPGEAIASLASDSRGGASIGLAAHVLADLMGHGVPLAVGIEVLGAWRGHGADPARLAEIPAAVERLVRQGVVPARAGAAIAGGLRGGHAPGSVRPVDIPRLIGRPGGG